MGLEVEATGDQRVEARIQRLARGGSQVGAADCSEFRAYEDGGAGAACAACISRASDACPARINSTERVMSSTN
jgi:hypothetical protein